MPHCLVTGGTSGIGAAVCGLAASRGFDVTVVARRVARVSQGHQPAVDPNHRVQLITADVAQEADVMAAFSAAEERFGPIDALVNSAGLGHNARVDTLTADAIAQLFAVNVLGTMLCCREAVRRMSHRHGGRGGSIVNVSSMAATIGGRPGASAYSASKAAVDSFSTGFAREVAMEGIRVNVVRPGVVQTPLTSHLSHDSRLQQQVEDSIPMGRLGTAVEVAEAVLWLLSDAASFVTGAHLDVGGGGFRVARLSN